MAIPDTRVIIVCTVASRDLVNATINNVDPTSTGDVMGAPLALPASPTTVVGYWASWAMESVTRQALMQAVRDAGWSPRPSNAERTLYVPGDNVPAWGSQRIWLFDGMLWAPDDVLTTLGLVRRGTFDG